MMFRKLMKAFNSAAEAVRGPAELGALYACWPWLSAHTPDGNNKPVLVLPGFTGSDTMTAPLRTRLADKGYDVHAWEGGVNTGFNAATAEHLIKRLHDIHARSGGQKVAIVGHSLGGIFARELARDFPHLVDRVVTLGSPFGLEESDAPALLLQLYKTINPHGDPTELSDRDLHLRRLTPPPGVPVTSIYSVSDGIVPWRACLNPQTALTENIAVPASHIGMIYHPMAVAAVLDRLAAPRKGWKPFSAAAYSPLYAWVGAAGKSDLPRNPKWKASAHSRPLFRKAQ